MTTQKGRLGWKATLATCCLIIAAAAGLTGLIFSTEPTAKQTGASKETAMLVETTSVQRGNFHPVIVAMGTVRPERDVVLRSRVGGTIVERSPEFTPGGIVEKGRMLLRIDAADYEIALEQRKSDLRQALADLKLEMGRQSVAKKDYQLLDGTLSEENKALVLRQPQLDTAHAKVRGARAAVRKAELDLRRTTVSAPFDAQILSRNVDAGSQVAVGDDLGRLVGLDTYWIEATVPQSDLYWISFPDDNEEKGSVVHIRNRSAWPEAEWREGRLHRLIGTLEERSRMARVLVTVDDPLGRRSGTPVPPALMIGAFVETRILGREASNVVRINREYVRTGDTVWIMENGRLDIRNVEIEYQDASHAYIRSGLEDGEQVVTTNLSTVVEGAALRRREPETARQASGDPSAASDGGDRRKMPANAGGAR